MSVINRNSGSPIFNTLAEAVASNMGIGQLPIVLGTSAAFDKGGIIYSVQANGAGGLAMSNGNELVQYTGTAAVADIQTSSTDTTVDAVLTVGAFGLGDDAIEVTDFTTDLVARQYNHFLRCTASTTGAPNANAFRGTYIGQGTIGIVTLTENNAAGGRLVFVGRFLSGVLDGTGWVEQYSTSNLQVTESLGLNVPRPMKNKSGALISDGDAVAGADISVIVWTSTGSILEGSAPTGTWKNVNGSGILNGYTGLMVRTV